MFRMVVQDSRRTPTSGKVVAQLGSYDPHAKTLILDKDKASFYLGNGAQPSDRVAILLKKEGVKLPEWVQDPAKKESAVRNPDKRRSTRPEEPAEEAPAEAAAAETADAPAEPSAEASTEAAAETETTEAAETPEADTPEASEDENPAAAEEPAADAAASENQDGDTTEAGEEKKS